MKIALTSDPAGVRGEEAPTVVNPRGPARDSAVAAGPPFLMLAGDITELLRPHTTARGVEFGGENSPTGTELRGGRALKISSSGWTIAGRQLGALRRGALGECHICSQRQTAVAGSDRRRGSGVPDCSCPDLGAAGHHVK
jgi:hypothetical protein